MSPRSCSTASRQLNPIPKKGPQSFFFFFFLNIYDKAFLQRLLTGFCICFRIKAPPLMFDRF